MYIVMIDGAAVWGGVQELMVPHRLLGGRGGGQIPRPLGLILRCKIV